MKISEIIEQLKIFTYFSDDCKKENIIPCIECDCNCEAKEMIEIIISALKEKEERK